MAKVFGTIQKCERASKAATNKTSNNEESTDISTAQNLN